MSKPVRKFELLYKEPFLKGEGRNTTVEYKRQTHDIEASYPIEALGIREEFLKEGSIELRGRRYPRLGERVLLKELNFSPYRAGGWVEQTHQPSRTPYSTLGKQYRRN